MEKILIINAAKSFAERMQTEFETENIPSERLRSRESILIIDGPNSIKFFNKNREVSLENSSIFMRLRGHDSHFCSLLAKIFSHKKIPFNDPVNAEHSNSNEKISQSVMLSLSDISIPKTIVCNAESFYNNEEVILNSISFPYVLKTDGSRGSRVWFIKNKRILTKILFKYNSLYIIQEYIENSYDMRVVVYKDKILGVIKRSAVDNFYNNVSKGARVDSVDLTEEEKVLAIRSCRTCGIDFGGVDIMRSERGPVVLEVNQAPQIVGFEGHTGVNVPEEIAKKIINNGFSVF